MALSKGKAKQVERLRNPRFRPREGCFLVEGVRVAREVLRGDLTPEVRFGLVSPRLTESPGGRDLMDALATSGYSMEEVTDRELEALSGTEHPQGVLLVVKEPKDPFAAIQKESEPRVLLLDAVQDPGNVGTLIRAAHAFGLTGVIALEGTVDPFNAKAVRASSGALAHLPVCRATWGKTRDWLEENAVPLLVADAHGEDIREFEPPPGWALAIGNEGAGPREDLSGGAAGSLAIPMHSGVDSLNAGVAGAILLFALSAFSGQDREF